MPVIINKASKFGKLKNLVKRKDHSINALHASS